MGYCRKSGKDFSDGLIADHEDTILLGIRKKWIKKLWNLVTYKYN